MNVNLLKNKISIGASNRNHEVLARMDGLHEEASFGIPNPHYYTRIDCGCIYCKLGLMPRDKESVYHAYADVSYSLGMEEFNARKNVSLEEYFKMICRGEALLNNAALDYKCYNWTSFEAFIDNFYQTEFLRTVTLERFDYFLLYDKDLGDGEKIQHYKVGFSARVFNNMNDGMVTSRLNQGKRDIVRTCRGHQYECWTISLL